MRIPHIFCLVDETIDLGVLSDVVAAGVSGVQVRTKRLPDRDLLGLAERVVAAVEPHGAVVVINDRVDLALAAGVAGVHLGAEDLPVAVARRIAPDLLIGATCRDRAQVEAAAREGADYAGFGPVFVTSSKAGLPEALGTEAVSAAAGALPLIGIAGITADNAADVIAAGAHGVAMIGDLWRHPDPPLRAKELVAAVAPFGG